MTSPSSVVEATPPAAPDSRADAPAATASQRSAALESTRLEPEPEPAIAWAPPAPARPGPSSSGPPSRGELGDLLAGASTRGWSLFRLTVRNMLFRRSVIVAILLVATPVLFAALWASDPSSSLQNNTSVELPGASVELEAELPQEVVQGVNWTASVTVTNRRTEVAEGRLTFAGGPEGALYEKRMNLSAGEVRTIPINVTHDGLPAGEQYLSFTWWEDIVEVHDDGFGGRQMEVYSYPTSSESVLVTVRASQEQDLFLIGAMDVEARVLYPSAAAAGDPVAGAVIIRNRGDVAQSVGMNLTLDDRSLLLPARTLPAGETYLENWTFPPAPVSGGFSSLEVRLTVGGAPVGTKTAIARGSTGVHHLEWKVEGVGLTRVRFTIPVAVQEERPYTISGSVRNLGAAPINITIRLHSPFQDTQIAVGVAAGSRQRFAATLTGLGGGVNEHTVEVIDAQTQVNRTRSFEILATPDPPVATVGKGFFLFMAGNMYIGFVIPLAALVFAGQNLSGEIEKRTMVLLALRPLRRIEIVLYKFLGYVISVTAITVGPLLALYLIVGSAIGPEEASAGVSLLLASIFSAFLAILGYGAIFTFLTVVPILKTWASLKGTMYWLLWELPSNAPRGLAGSVCAITGGMSLTRYVKSVLYHLSVYEVTHADYILQLRSALPTFGGEMVETNLAAPLAFSIGVIVVVAFLFLALSMYLFRRMDLR